MDVRRPSAASKLIRCIAFTAFSFAAFDSFAADTGFTFGAEHLVWKEFDGGEKLLEENGTRYLLGIDRESTVGANPNLLLNLSATLYVGSVAYDGQACTTDFPQTCVPFETDTDYRGVNAEAILARRYGRTSGSEVFGGVGVDAWRREIQGTADVSGAVEKWSTLYGLLGGGGYWSSGASRTSARVGFKYPFRSRNAASDVTLEPKGRSSWFVRFAKDFLRADKPTWGFGLRYDSYRFDESDAHHMGPVVVWQPESTQDTVVGYLKYYLH